MTRRIGRHPRPGLYRRRPEGEPSTTTSRLLSPASRRGAVDDDVQASLAGVPRGAVDDDL
jgi:hypothetical protein